MADNLTAEIYSKPLTPINACSYRVRIAKWDNIKFLLILSVVCGHFFDIYAGTSDLLHGLRILRLFIEMPGFIFISGLFAKKTVNSNSLSFYKILPYFNLYLVTNILFFVVARLTLYPKAQFTLFYFSNIAWFAFAIFIFHIIAWLIRDIDVRYTMFFAVLLASFAGYDKNIGNFLCLSHIILLFPFFLAGCNVENERLLAFLERKGVKLLSAGVLLFMTYMVFAHTGTFRKFSLFLCWQFSFPAADKAASILIGPMPWCIVRAVHLVLVAVVCLSFFSLVPSKSLPFTILGQRTVSVYALHMPVLYLYRYSGVHNIFRNIFGAYWDVAFFMIPLAVTLLLSAKCFSKLFDPLLHPKTIQKNSAIYNS